MRALKSTVNAAVLSLVIARPSTAYEVGRRFVAQFGSLFASSPRNVYTTLERLEAQRMIERFRSERPAADGAVRIHLRATAAGARAYREWLGSPLEGGPSLGVPMDPGVPRRDVLVRLQALRPADLTAVAAILDAYEALLLQQLQQRRHAPEEGLIGALLRDERTLAAQAQLQWVAAARGRLLEAARTADAGEAGDAEATRWSPPRLEAVQAPVARRRAGS